MARAILIAGTGRSGTSVLAGAVQKLGVHFCDHLVGPHPEHNPLGHFECRQWWQIGHDDLYPSVSEYERLIETHEREPVWAVKDTWLRWGLHEVVPIMSNDTRVIVSHRQFAASIRSREKHAPAVDAERDMVRRAHRLFAFLSAVHVPVLHIDYERLVVDPAGTMTTVAAFIFDGLEQFLSPHQLASAVGFVDPALNHQSVAGGTGV